MTSLQNIILTEVDRNRLQAVIDRELQNRRESRHCVDDLQRELDRAQIVDSGSMPDGVVAMNSTVCLRDLDSNEVETYVLVYPQDADINRNRISVLAPVGTAIIGCHVGDVVVWSVPRGRVRWRVEDVVAPTSLHGQPIRTLLCES